MAAMTSGYLAPVATPHIYQHVPERFHVLLHELAQPIGIDEVSDRADYAPDYVKNHAIKTIRECLYIEHHGNSSAWRVELTRLYYGIDRCRCQR